MRPFRFACRVSGGRGRSAADWAELARHAETLRYSTFAVSDHFATQYAPLLLLQLAAAKTQRIRLTTLVLDNDLRHPALLAKEAATLDLLSEGRFELGIGAGWLREEYQHAGIPFDDGARRAARLVEAVQVITALFADEPVSFSGRFYTIEQLDGRPKPVQRPRPPLLIGATQSKLLRFAARTADIVSFDSGPEPPASRFDALRRQADTVREAAPSTLPELHLNPDVWAITDRRGVALQEAASRLSVSAEHLEQSAYALVGTAQQVIDYLERLRAELGISYVTIPSDRMDEFAPVVEALEGK